MREAMLLWHPRTNIMPLTHAGLYD